MAKNKKQEQVVPYVPTRTKEGNLLWDVSLIKPNPKQPRGYFDREKLDELKGSIEAIGITTPLRILLLDIQGHAKLVDGERRYRIAKELGLSQVPVVISALSPQDIHGLLRESVVANFCRADMTELEMAKSLKQMMKDYGYSHEQCAKIVGKSTAWVYNMLKYLKLHPHVAAKLEAREISPAIALAATRFPPIDQPKVTDQLIKAKDQKGRSLTSAEISMEVAKFAKDGKAKVLRPSKGKRPDLNPDRMLAKVVIKELEQLFPHLENLLLISSKDLEAIGGDPLIALEQEGRKIHDNLAILLERLGKAI